MRKLFLLFAVAVLMSSCTVYDDIYSVNRTAKYSFRLSQVEPPEAIGNGKMVTSIVKTWVTNNVVKYTYRDSLISTYWSVDNGSMSLSLFNNTNKTLKILWDEAAFVDPISEASPIIHDQIKFAKMEDAKVPSVVPKGAVFRSTIAPINNIIRTENGWHIGPLFPALFDSDEDMEAAKQFEGKEFSVLLPIEVDNVKYEYTFFFTVDKVATQKDEEHNSVVNYNASMGRTTVLLTLLFVGGLVVTLLAI